MLLEILFVGRVEGCGTEDGECRACWLKGSGPSGCGWDWSLSVVWTVSVGSLESDSVELSVTE